MKYNLPDMETDVETEDLTPLEAALVAYDAHQEISREFFKTARNLQAATRKLSIDDKEMFVEEIARRTDDR